MKKLINSLLNVKCYLLSERSGLTLIELLVVMSIIAILAAGIWGNFFTSLYKGRDSRRKQDLGSISRAVEMYYTDNRNYPNPTSVVYGSALVHPNNSNVIYMQKLPVDPTAGKTYCYLSAGTYYKLYTNLENTSDPTLITPVICPIGSTNNYNYGISSPNTTP